MSDQSTEPSEESVTTQIVEINGVWNWRMFVLYALLALILATLMDIHDTLKDQKGQEVQPSVEELDLAYEQVEILYETQQIICDALDGPNEQVSDTAPINTEQPSIPTTTTTPVTPPPYIPGEAPPPTPAVDPIEAYC